MTPRFLTRWLCPPRDDLDLQLAIAHARRELEKHITAHITRLENLIVTTAQDVIARFDNATTEVANDLAGLRSRLEAAVADKDEAVRSAVAGVLSEFDAPIARLEALGADPADPVPAPEEPAPAEPGSDEPVA